MNRNCWLWLVAGLCGVSAFASSPGALDWRNVDGTNWLGRVMNQGKCQSSVAFAAIAALEARTSIAAGIPWLNPRFSAQELFSCAGAYCDQGWEPGWAALFLENRGVTDEACMPDSSSATGEDVSCNERCVDAPSRATKIAGYSTPSTWLSGDMNSIKTALKNGPLITTLTVYGDFLKYSGGVYRHVSGSRIGEQAVTLVGYDDSKRAWLIQNSWGTSWGEKGFAWVSWDDVSGVGSLTWALDVHPESSYLSVFAPQDGEQISGRYAVVVQSHGVALKDIRVHLTDPAGQDAAIFGCVARRDGTCEILVDTTSLRDGRYEIYADGGKAPVRSQFRGFSILNPEPK